MALEASLRIRADTAQAVAGVNKLKGELQGLKDAGGKGAGGSGGASPLAPLVLDADKAKRAVEELRTRSKAAAEEARRAQRQAALLVPQLNDVFTQLASGTSPLTVLVQQGPQIRDVMGSWSNAGKALLGVFTPLRLAIGGIATVAGAFALAAFQGAQESRELARAMAFTGNAAGVTAGQVEALTTRIAEGTKQSRGDVRATLTELVASGRFTATSLASAAAGVDGFAKLTGRTREQAVGDYIAMADGVAAWAAKYDRSLNFLSAAQLKQIRTLEQQGRTQEAVRIASDAIDTAARERYEPTLGRLEKAWRGVGLAISGAWEALKAIGRDKSAEEAVDHLRQQLQLALDQQKFGVAGFTGAQGAARIASLQQQLAAAAERVRQVNTQAQSAADAAAAEQEKKRRQEAGFQGAQAQQQVAAAAKRLAQLNTQLDDERDAVQRHHAQGLVDERAYQEQLGQIELRRLRAQADNLREQRAIEAARNPGDKPQDALAQRARLQQLDAQIIDANSRATSAAVKLRTDADAAALADARAKAAEWAATWQRAADAVRQFAQRNDQTAAEREGDPAQRARREAEIAVAEARRVFEAQKLELQVQIDLTDDPEQRRLLQAKLQALTREGTQAIAEDVRRKRFDSLAQQFDELNNKLALGEQALDQQVEQGALTTEDAERRKLAARAQAVPQLEAIRDLLAQIALTPAERNAVAGINQAVAAARDMRSELDKTARSAGISGLSTVLTDIETGAKRGKEALLDMVGSFARAMLEVINRRLAEALVNSMVPTGGNAGGGVGAVWAGFTSWIASLFHTGGVVGAPGGMRRAVPAAAFALAPRYHGGGTVPGLMPGDVPAVLRAGETVRTPEQERSLQRNLGGVTVTNNVTISGAGAGNDGGVPRAALDDMQRMQEEMFTRWALKHMRPGGLLAQRR
ncbi:MAG: phage tail length tape measure family protein [Ideonella sp.]|nr:phage tail length tape measure family protein [Ideonella sp.]MCC7455993.1 phage tail length tape measure family protein [Nitrospira sp.]